MQLSGQVWQINVEEIYTILSNKLFPLCNNVIIIIVIILHEFSYLFNDLLNQ
jgi:hypothetical protein